METREIGTMLRKVIAAFVVTGVLFGGGLALAQAPGAPGGAMGDGANVTYKKKTVYDFDDDVVEGELQRPDGEYIDTRRKAKHSSLIKIRENFIPEMLKSAEDI
jgi:hypothetical protein